jgi:hypothetical protein
VSAFNSRLKPKELWGLPLPAALGLVAALVFGVLSMLLPLVIKIITIPCMIFGLIAAVAALVLGDDIQWVGVKHAGIKVENGRVSSEVDEWER